MKVNNKKIGIEYWVVIILSYTLSIFLFVLNLSEFIKVGILKNKNNYPFGIEGIWYYKTASTYSFYCLTWSFILLIPILFCTFGIIKKKKVFIIISFVLAILSLIILKYGNGFENNI